MARTKSLTIRWDPKEPDNIGEMIDKLRECEDADRYNDRPKGVIARMLLEGALRKEIRKFKLDGSRGGSKR